MATSSRELQIPKKWRSDQDDLSPDRTKIWTEPAATPVHCRVPVVYYLSRNGNLEHPHFMEIALSNSPQGGLFLRDFIKRLNQLRGKGIASLYSWSSKRSYKNGFVWHDLTENDFIYPSHGTEYVLKGSELHDLSPEEEAPPFRSPSSTESHIPSSCHSNLRAVARRRNQSMSAIELCEYKVYKTESAGGLTLSRAAANASTQTYDGQQVKVEEEEEIQELQYSAELSREETSPPPLDSSPETLETILKTRGRLRLSDSGPTEDGGSLPGGRLRASSVLMQLISCGAVPFKGCGAFSYLKGQGLSMVAHSKVKMSKGAGNHRLGTHGELSNLSGQGLENKEYFSGSLVETKRELIPTLKRSCSYNTKSI